MIKHNVALTRKLMPVNVSILLGFIINFYTVCVCLKELLCFFDK